jgi:hypothetical protein
VFAGNGGFAAASGASDVENEIELSKMHEIDPQSGNSSTDERLTKALRGLAESSRQGAPAEVGAGLATAFRRHHARRRLVRGMSVAALAACVAFMIGWVSLRSGHQSPTRETVQNQPSAVPASASEALPVAKAASTGRPAVRRVKPNATNKTASASRQFLALPGYDPAVPVDELHVVRVELPASALWQMGAPVSPDSGARKFMADFVVSQDGTPYAVRLVQ